MNKIIIPKKYFHSDQRMESDYEKPVIPATDQWIVSPERKWEEVDQVLEGRLQGIQASFINIDQSHLPDRTAQSYGVDRPIGNNLARLFSYAEMTNEYSTLVDQNREKIEARKREYEDYKTDLKTQLTQKRLSQGEYQKRLRAFYTPERNTQVADWSQKIELAQQMQQLIYRKAAMDIFSLQDKSQIQPLVIENFPQLFAQAISIDQPKNVLTFFSGLTNYLSTTNDKSLFIHYKYRSLPGIVKNNSDCLVLDATLRMALGSNNLPPEASSQYQLLGKAYHKFLTTRALHLSVINGSEEFPINSLVYDILTTAVFSDDADIIKGIAGFIDTNLRPHVNGRICLNESRQLGERSANVKIRTRNQQSGQTATENYFSEPSPELKLYLDDNDATLSLGLLTYNSFVEKYKKFFLLHQSIVIGELESNIRTNERRKSDIIHRSEGEAVEWGRRLMVVYEQTYFEASKNGYFRRLSSSRNLLEGLLSLSRGLLFPIQGETDITETLRSIVKKLNEERQEPVAIKDKLVAIKLIQDKKNKCAEPDKSLYDNETLKLYLRCFFGERDTNSAETRQENDYLRREIIDNSKWFVSPRGDRFSVNNDPELANFAIQSITFGIDKAYPRHHQVSLQIESLSEPLVFWIDNKGEIMGRTHETLIYDPGFKDCLGNLVLRRLYTITSGLLSEGDDPEAGIGSEPSFAFTRAHYDKLISTPGRRITMESHGAQVHATEIKEDYGIDIFEEIRRRRARGTLKQSEFITFSREHTPPVIPHPIRPNELTYDSSKVFISVT